MQRISLIFFLLLFIPCLAPKPPQQSVPTKICANKSCTQPLFSTDFVRSYRSTHENFLNAVEGEEVNIVGIKYTRRSDNFYAEVNGTFGFVFTGHLDLIPYVFFLENALKENHKFYRVQHHDDPKIPNNFVDEVNANPEFYRDYTVNAEKVNVPINDKIVEIKPEEDEHSHHGHSHSHHGHSHSHHGHSHEIPTTLPPQPVEIPVTTQQPPVEEVKVEVPTPVEQIKVEEKELPTTTLSPPVDLPTTTLSSPIDLPPPVTTEVPKKLDLPPIYNPVYTNPVDSLPSTTALPPVEPENSPSNSHQVDAIPIHNNEPKVPEQLNVEAILDSLKSDELPKQDDLPPPQKDPIIQQELPTTTFAPPPVQTESITKPVAHVDPIPQTTEVPPVESAHKNEEKGADKTEFCYKENCSTQSGATMSEPNIIQSTARSIMANLRSSVPALSFLDDTGIILLLYVIAWLAIYLIGMLFKDKKSPDALDRRALFDARTKLKEQEVEIANLRERIPNPAEQDQLLHKYREMERQLINQHQTVEELRSQLIDPRLLTEKEEIIARMETEHNQQIAEITRQKDAEISKLRTDVSNLSSNLKSKQKTIDDLVNENNELKEAVKEHKDAAEDLQQKYDSMIAVFAEQKSRNGEESTESDGSGASGGWSNVGNDLDLDGEMASDKKDYDETVESGKPSPTNATKTEQTKGDMWSTDTIKDLAKAKADLRRIEGERDQLSLKIQSIQSEKKILEERISHLTKEAESLRVELKEKKTQADKREDEASSQREQLNKLLEMVNDKDQKISRAEAEQSNLKDSIRQYEIKIHEFEILKQKHEQKIRELEERIDKAEEMKTKLQNRWFHEEREHLSKVKKMEETIAQLQSKLNTSYDAPNAASPTSERDYGGRTDDVPDLWSPFSNNAPRRESRNLPPGSANMSNNASFQLDTSDEASQQIRLPRQLSHRESQEKRRRSRSAGRSGDPFSSYPSGRRSAHHSGHVSPATSLLLNQSTSITSPFYERQSGGIHRPPSTGSARLPKSASNVSNFLNYGSDDSNPTTDFVPRSGVPPPSSTRLSKPQPVVSNPASRIILTKKTR